MQIIIPITINVDKKNLIEPIIAKQYDQNSRYIKATINNQNSKMEVSSGASVSINAKRADGTSGSFSGIVNEDGTVNVPITSWMLEIDDTVKCSITVVTGNEKITTSSFDIDVEASEETSGQVEQPITFYLGTTYPLILTLIDEDGDPYDLASGESVILTVAATVSGTAVITKTVSANDGTSGEYAFEFAASDTSELSAGMYTYKIMLTSSTLNLPIVIPSPFELLAI